jgi:hypothetical protein
MAGLTSRAPPPGRRAHSERLRAVPGSPAGSSAAKAVVPRSVFFCQEIAVPASWGTVGAAIRRPARRPSRYGGRLLAPRPGRGAGGMVKRGCRRRISACAIRASSSDNDRGPDAYTPLLDHQRQGKLRLRSTPCAFWRVPAATPSGFRSGTIQRSSPAGDRRSRTRATAMPPVSFPWMKPTTSTGVPDGVPDLEGVDWPRLPGTPEEKGSCEGGRGQRAPGDERRNEESVLTLAGMVPMQQAGGGVCRLFRKARHSRARDLGEAGTLLGASHR